MLTLAIDHMEFMDNPKDDRPMQKVPEIILVQSLEEQAGSCVCYGRKESHAGRKAANMADIHRRLSILGLQVGRNKKGNSKP